MSHGSDLHAGHDALLVAALAADDLDGAERATATSLVRDCAECRALHDDLISIARATAALPAAARPRDFRISADQAARLRPAGWRGLVAAFAAPRMAFTRSLGVGLTTLGLAGLLLSALPSIPLGIGSAATASMPPEVLSASGEDAAGEPLGPVSQGGSESDGSPAPSGQQEYLGTDGRAAASAPAASAAPAPAASPGSVAVAPTQREATAEPGGASTDDQQRPGDVLAATSPPSDVPPLVIVSAVLVLLGLALLVIRRIAARIAAG